MPGPTITGGGMQRVQPAPAANPSTTAPSNPPPSATPRSTGAHDWNAEDLQKVVLEYLTKKGFHKAETLLRLEASQMQEATLVGERYKSLTEAFYGTYHEAYELLRNFIEQSLDLFKVELARILWPTFAYLYMDLLAESKDPKQEVDKLEEGTA